MRFCIRSFAPLKQRNVFTLHFLFFLHPHTSSQAHSMPSLKDLHKSSLLSYLHSVTLISKRCPKGSSINFATLRYSLLGIHSVALNFCLLLY